MRVREYLGIPYFVDDGPPRRVWGITDTEETPMTMDGKHILKLDRPAWKEAITEYLNRRMMGTVVIDSFENIDDELADVEIHFQLKANDYVPPKAEEVSSRQPAAVGR